MKGWGKVIGGFLGLWLAGPSGLLLGIFWGHIFDQGNLSFLKPKRHWRHHDSVQSAFFESTFRVMGYIARLDGRISEAEIRVARSVMQRMNLNESLCQQAMQLFNQGKQPGFSLESTLRYLIASNRYNHALLQLFVEIQIQTALAEGSINLVQQRALDRICQYLGFNRWQFNSFEPVFTETFRFQRQKQQYQQYRQTQDSHAPSDLQRAYALLSVNPQASDAEVKQAYRRLRSQNHPDKLLAKKLPKSTIQLATEKMQRLQAAYELIGAARKW